MKWHLRELHEIDSAEMRLQNRSEFDEGFSFADEFGPNISNFSSMSSRSRRSSLMSQPDEMKRQNSRSNQKNRRYTILICTDFAFPKLGGVETHGYQLGQCLIERGHKVVFITNKF